MQLHAFACDIGMDVELDRHRVTRSRSLTCSRCVRLLEECKERNAHLGPQQIRGSCSPDNQSTIRAPPKLVAICTK